MAREKATITLDRSKAAEARELLGVESTSEAVDIALDRLIRAERLHADVEAYRRSPHLVDESTAAPLASFDGLADETDWETLYAEELR
jgi:Arc/MetJ family transcription regulator